MAQENRHLMDEADIGSGEKTAGQQQVEQAIRSVNGTQTGATRDGSHLHQAVEEQAYAAQRPGASEQQAHEEPLPGRILQSGTHLARILAAEQPDGSYEAQVFVRLTREPEVAETYIPVGIYPQEAQAWSAAEERAKRAFQEHEF